MSRKNKSARLVLEDGSVFEGISIGAEISVEGEVVFSTGMVGYNQSLTDPSYCGQILVFAYPLIGNYGVPALRTNAQGIPLNFESKRIQASAVVVAEASMEPSHYTAAHSFSEWLNIGQVPGIAGIDTRKLIRLLRESGVMRGRILIEGTEEPVQDELKAHAPVKLVSPEDVVRYKGRPGAPRIALVDCGVKANILRILLDAGAEVIRLPGYPLDSIESRTGLFRRRPSGCPDGLHEDPRPPPPRLSEPHPYSESARGAAHGARRGRTPTSSNTGTAAEPAAIEKATAVRHHEQEPRLRRP